MLPSVSMIHLLILAVHLLATIAKLVRPGGVRAVVAESLLLKHQLLISSRARRALPDENAQACRHRNGAARPGLQHETRDENSRRWRIDGGNPRMRQASQASINPRSSPQGAIKRPHGPILPNWPRRTAQSRRDLRSRHPQTTPTAFLHGLGHSRPIHSGPVPPNVRYAP